MKKTLVKVGDKVFHFIHGWVEIIEVSEHEVATKDRDGNTIYFEFNNALKVLSSTEYDLVNGGFTPITIYEEIETKQEKESKNDIILKLLNEYVSDVTKTEQIITKYKINESGVFTFYTDDSTEYLFGNMFNIHGFVYWLFKND